MQKNSLNQLDISAKRVYPPSGNVSDPNYLIFYNKEIEAGTTYSFRVTTQVAKQYGKWSKWLKMATSMLFLYKKLEIVLAKLRFI